MPLALCLVSSLAFGQGKRKVIVDQDAAGPGGSDMQAILMAVQSPETETLGITVVTGDQWLDEELAHTLRLLEIIGRRDIPVLAGAEFPLVRTRPQTLLWEKTYGSFSYMGAWTPQWYHPASVIPPMREGVPTLKPSTEDAAHFMIRMVHKYPHQVTIIGLGPMTNIALAIRLDPHFAELAQELVFMGGSLSPQTNDPEFSTNPRHEFNLWFDPEAAHIMLTAHWAKITCTPVDISIKTHFSHDLLRRIGQSQVPVAQYLAKYDTIRDDFDYMWDELAVAAWLKPSLITQDEKVYMDVDLDKGVGYGNTQTWDKTDKPAVDKRVVTVNLNLHANQFYDYFQRLMTNPTPGASPAQ
ncbi:MAG TPA: nucleoside hydrolase [Terriglobia bacterium]|nr:nucleoside hydrolase [Terriglobia bacterium]